MSKNKQRLMLTNEHASLRKRCTYKMIVSKQKDEEGCA